MEILDKYNVGKEGNDCLIIESIALIRVTYGFYIVIHATEVIGSWTNHPIETKYGNFHSYNEAKIYYNELYERIK